MNTRWPRSSLACQPTPLATGRENERSVGRAPAPLRPCVPAHLPPGGPKGEGEGEDGHRRRGMVDWSLGRLTREWPLSYPGTWRLGPWTSLSHWTLEPSGAGQTLADVRLLYSHGCRQVDSAQAAPSRAPFSGRGLRVCGLAAAAAGAGAGGLPEEDRSQGGTAGRRQSVEALPSGSQAPSESARAGRRTRRRGAHFGLDASSGDVRITRRWRTTDCFHGHG